jgi:hypothetical protein
MGDFMTLLAVVGVLGTLAGVAATIAVYKLTARKPRVFFDSHGNGVLSRCLPALKDGWGIISVSGKLRVSHKPVTIVDAQLAYKMDPAHVRLNSKPMCETFPPLFVFERVANDERASTVSLSRRSFDTIKVVPGEGEKDYRGHFTLGGHFAAEYSADFFEGKLSSVGDMFIPMMIKFEYEYNGDFHWTEYFNIIVHPCANMGWTPNGPKYINEDGEPLNVVYKGAQ